MTDPIKPPGSASGPGALDGVDEAERAEGAQGPRFADEVEASRRSAQASASDPLLRAVSEVAADVRAGRVPDAQAATDAVIIRLVDLRYGHLEPARREGLVMQLHAMLQNDPRFQARIEELLSAATQ